MMLLVDDFNPHEQDHRMLYDLWDPEDKKHFVSLQNAHAHMINEVHAVLADEFPGCRMEFCPPWYNNSFVDRSRGWAEQYFRDLIAQIPEDVAIVWTGSTVRSLSIDMADIERFRGLIGRYPMLFDNTLYARRNESSYGGYAGLYPGKVRMCSLFEAHDVRLPEGFHRFNAGGHLYQNGTAETELSKIQYATVADYEWNTAAYNPDRSLWKALLTIYGRTAALQLLELNDAYYEFADMKMRIKRDGRYEAYVSRAEEAERRTRGLLEALEQTVPDGRRGILAELTSLIEKMELSTDPE